MRNLILVAGLLLAFPVAATAADVLINNGLAPPNPANVIDDDAYQSDDVYVRNVGCPPDGSPDPGSACPTPGDPTAVAFVDGGSVQRLAAYDSSTIEISGGTMPPNAGVVLSAVDSVTITISGGTVQGEYVYANDSAVVEMSNGYLWGSLWARGSSVVTFSGGTVGTWLMAEDSSTVTMSGGEVVNSAWSAHSANLTISGGVMDWVAALDSSTTSIVGRSFEVNGNPVPYGPLTTTTGILTGTLASGESLDTYFDQGGGSFTGTIILVRQPLPVPALSMSGKLLLAAALFGIGLLRGRRVR